MTVNCTWEAVSGATEYLVYFGEDENFYPHTYLPSTSSDTSWTWEGFEPFDTEEYFCKVKVYSSDGSCMPTGSWSPVGSINGYCTTTPPPSEFPLPTGPLTEVILGDINDDNVVDIQDYNLLSNDFGPSDPYGPVDKIADLNFDTTVDIQDFIILSKNFGRTI